MRLRYILILIISILIVSSATSELYGTIVEHEVLFEPSFESSFSCYSTYFGGSSSDDSSRVTLDLEGNILVKFVTSSPDIDTTPDAFQTQRNGSDDGFVAKFSPSGDLIFATYFGGSDDEHIAYIGVDCDNNIILTGATWSTDFPVTENAYLDSYQGGSDGFILRDLAAT